MVVYQISQVREARAKPMASAATWLTVHLYLPPATLRSSNGKSVL
jgi:hypothetical protein